MRALLWVIALALLPQAAAAQALSQLPELVETATPTYPEAAAKARVGATVLLRLDLDVDGRVETATVVRTTTAAFEGAPEGPQQLRERFAEAALAAAPRLRFTPALAGSQPVPVSLHYSFSFEPPLPPAPPAPAPELPAGVVRLEGTVLEAGTRRRLPGALVVITRGDEAYEATCDDEGRFRLFDLAEGSWTIIVDAAGLERFEASETTGAAPVEVRYYLRAASTNPYDVIVEGQRPRREVTRRALGADSAATVAGTMGDPVLAIEDLPGIARAGTGNGRPVRGSSPQDTRYYVEGLPILFDEHVGGFRSVLPSQMVERVDFFPGNFSARYGRGTGGVVDVKLKALEPDQLHGAFDISLLDAGLYLEAPLGDSAAIAVAGRRSYIDAVLSAVVPDDGDVRLTTAPRWYDYQLLVDWRPAAHHRVRIFGLGADDALAVGFANAADADLDAKSDTASTRYDYQRLSLQHRFTPSPTFSNDLRLGLGRDAGANDVFGRISLGFRFASLSLREEAKWRIHPRLTLVGGLDGRLEEARYDVYSFRPPKEGEVFATLPSDEESVAAVGQRRFANVAGFVEAEWTPLDRLTIVPGIRVDYLGLTDTVRVDPRLVARFEIDEAWTVSAGAGLVHQAPELDEVIAPFGNPDVDPMRALQTSASVRWQPTDRFFGDVTLFHKRLSNLVRSVDGPEIYRNEGSGQVIGMEAFLRLRPWHGLSGWLSYTLSRARRTDVDGEGSRPFDYDQTHILSLVGRYALPANWSVGLRWRLVTGRPTTPFVGGVFFESDDAYRPITGDTNSSRLPAFHMLDLRVDKRWVFDMWSLTTYLSLSNAYNRANAEDIAYSFDYRAQEPVAGVPLLPILGVIGEF